MSVSLQNPMAVGLELRASRGPGLSAEWSCCAGSGSSLPCKCRMGERGVGNFYIRLLGYYIPSPLFPAWGLLSRPM